MLFRRHLTGAALAAALFATTTACGGGDDETAGPTDPSTTSSTSSREPTSTPTSSDPTSGSPSPTPDPDAWRSKFTDEQLREFDLAVGGWTEYERLLNTYQSEPPDNPEAVRQLFERFSYNATALFDSFVTNFVEGGVRIVTPPTPVSITGRTIEVNEKGSLVEFDQCTDYTQLDIRRDGKPIDGAAPTERDRAIIRVKMAYEPATSTANGGWRVFDSEVVDKPCE